MTDALAAVTAERDALRAMLSEALDLCVRARRMDEADRRQGVLSASKDPDGWIASGAFDRYVARHNLRYPDRKIATRSVTVHLWVLEQYENDRAAWERNARAALAARAPSDAP